eukprot:4573263-Amphidinium_carterae.2
MNSRSLVFDSKNVIFYGLKQRQKKAISHLFHADKGFCFVNLMLLAQPVLQSESILPLRGCSCSKPSGTATCDFAS